MGIHAIKMPDIGEGIAEVELVAWRVRPGEAVEEDQVLADVMTDKATVEIPSPVRGQVASLGGEAGQMMAVGAELIRLEVDGPGNVREAAAQPVREPAVATQAREPAPAGPAGPTPSPAAPQAPAQAHMPAASAASLAPGERPLASPSVRRHARELDIDLHGVRGSGPGGRITHEDLEASHAAQGRAPEPQAGEGEHAVPLTALRRRIAQQMQESMRRIPHFSYVEEIDVTELERLRGQLNERFGEARGRLTLLPFIARAMVLALQEFPQLNARFDDEAGVVTRFDAVHLGVATQTDAGLMVPVLRHAQAQDLWGLAREIARLAQSVRGGRAPREVLGGSTITLTSLGALGGIASTPVINHPEVAIVGVNRVVERPMFQGAAVVPRRLMNLSSSFDHRVIDGMDAARFIQSVRGWLECPALLLVDGSPGHARPRTGTAEPEGGESLLQERPVRGA
ncbi:dihydrolipoamide acetyltransferase family protein [Ramlibacter rhizophilus]|uniref:Dihydrolipoamide acetyltransferase component of pyruvate dehydrogenase complex n=1 Tax=Ramlibacter rhizophilus TaxID=1781167 RepID=A0A4Z0BH67_9BURK|nr:dihydrolipoamide acetyltransferase family protein [Ramlibacter rhizophilus]TFY98642.1 2-oxo acid dehydrogenase subunit E2 [Ramlibacter rhizophilus]